MIFFYFILDIDTQTDFVYFTMEKFYIRNADKYKPLWADITRYARQKKKSPGVFTFIISSGEVEKA